MSERIAIIAALKREVAPFVRECGFTGCGKSWFWNRLGFLNRLEGARLQPRRKKSFIKKPFILSFRAGFSPRGIWFDFFRSLSSPVEAHDFGRVEAHGFSRVKRAGEADGASAPALTAYRFAEALLLAGGKNAATRATRFALEIHHPTLLISTGRRPVDWFRTNGHV